MIHGLYGKTWQICEGRSEPEIMWVFFFLVSYIFKGEIMKK
jgi:hypothetical protein